MPSLIHAILCALALLSTLSLKAEDTLKVYILAGQSNMSGRADAKLLPAHPADKEILYYYQFDPQASPRTFVHSSSRFLTLGPQMDRFGPEMGIGRTLYEAGEQKIALIKLSHGGTNLYEQWKKGEHQLYEKMIMDIKVALLALAPHCDRYELAGFFWMQGESDAGSEERANAYESNLRSLMEHIRADLNHPNLKFILGRIRYDQKRTYQETLRWAQMRVTRWDEHADWVSTDDLNTIDGTHYDAPGTLELGRRMAQAWLALAGMPAIKKEKYDVAVYGATPAGIAAAVSAGRMGMQVGLFEGSDHLGGMMTGGMSNPDFKTFESLGGLYVEFMDRVEKYYADTYGPESQQVADCYRGVWYEPKVAGLIFRQMLAEAGVKVHLSHPIVKATPRVQGNGQKAMLERAVFARPEEDAVLEVSAKAFIDATYEGDLLAKAGVAYRVGRESRAEYGELYAGVKYFQKGVFLSKSTGAADQKVQCYNFRLCMTTDPENRLPVPKPDGYRREEFLPLLALMQSGQVQSVSEGIVRFRPIPNQKADVNDIMYSPFSLRLVGDHYQWPEGSDEVRKDIFERYRQYSLGLFYFLQNDPEVPETIRREALAWGLPADEFETTNHFPPILYVREARRMIGDFVLTEHDTQPFGESVRSQNYPNAVAICDYSMDSHGNGAEIPDYPGVTEGVFNKYVVPYQIPYRVMIPARVDGLIVPVAVSASHAAFSSLRMEPTWVALGQAAGIAAALSVKEKQALRAISPTDIQQILHETRAMTVYLSDVAPDSPYFRAAQYFGTRGFFHDLPEYRDVPDIGRGQKNGLPGQYLAAYPYHELRPELPMTGELVERWAKLSKIKVEESDYRGKSRGDFLVWLWGRLVE